MSDRKERGFVAAGSLVRPGWLGRGARLVLGVVILYAILPVIPAFAFFRDAPAPPDDIGLWILAALLFLASRDVVNLGLGVRWGRWPQLGILVLTGVAVAASAIFYGRAWGPPAGILFYVWLVGTAVALGVAFVLSAFLGTPGCEMRSYADLRARLRGRDASEHYCPGGIDVVDRFEQRVRKR